MTRHLLRLVWNRRRANALIALEILLSFLVLVAVVTTATYLGNNYRQPLGFVYDDVWAVRVSMDVPDGGEDTVPPDRTPAARRERLNTLMGLVRDMPGVISVATVNDAPYSHSGWSSTVTTGGRTFEFDANRASDDFARTMRLTITRGRWFGPDDNGAAWEPVVVNERFATMMFGAQDPIGRMIRPDAPKEGDQHQQPTMRVVGVMSDYRKDGEFSPGTNWLFYRSTLGPATLGPNVPRNLVVRAIPGSSGAFEARLVDLLDRNAPEMSFRARPLVLARATMLREGAPTLAAEALIAGFLLAMVALGLTGVLWLTVTQRTREIGLRRAKGATIPNVRHQVLAEVLILTTASVVIGIVIVVQFPALEVFGTVTAGVYAAGLCVSVACIYLLSLVCAWMPSRLASAIPPAEALRYE